MKLVLYALYQPKKYKSKTSILRHTIYDQGDSELIVPDEFSDASINPQSFIGLKKKFNIESITILDRLKPDNGPVCVVDFYVSLHAIEETSKGERTRAGTQRLSQTWSATPSPHAAHRESEQSGHATATRAMSRGWISFAKQPSQKYFSGLIQRGNGWRRSLS